MANVKKLQADIKEIKAALEDKDTPENAKEHLRKGLSNAEARLEAALKEAGSEEKKEEKPKPAPVKKETQTASEQIDKDCEEIIAQLNAKKKTEKKRREKRSDAGKPPVLTPSETVKKAAKAVKHKAKMVVTEEGKLTVAETNKSVDGIIDMVRSIMKSLDLPERKKFFDSFFDRLSKVYDELKKEPVATFADGGNIEKETDPLIKNLQDLQGNSFVVSFKKGTDEKFYFVFYNAPQSFSKFVPAASCITMKSIEAICTILDFHTDQKTKMEMFDWVLQNAVRMNGRIRIEKKSNIYGINQDGETGMAVQGYDGPLFVKYKWGGTTDDIYAWGMGNDSESHTWYPKHTVPPGGNPKPLQDYEEKIGNQVRIVPDEDGFLKIMVAPPAKEDKVCHVCDAVEDDEMEEAEMMKSGGQTLDLSNFKEKMIAKAKRSGISENFGQKELRALQDKYPENPAEIAEMEEWLSNFDMEFYRSGGHIPCLNINMLDSNFLQWEDEVSTEIEKEYNQTPVRSQEIMQSHSNLAEKLFKSKTKAPAAAKLMYESFFYSKGGSVKKDDDLTKKVAIEFIRELKKDLTARQIKEINRRNKMRNDGTCATHDFVDANVYMLDSFEKTAGRDFMPLKTGNWDHKDSIIFDRAWDMAKAAQFDEKNLK